MFELNGKYNSCKVFTDNCDNETISQLTALLNQESVSGSRIRIMPDTHAGKGSVIGTTMTISDKVIPNIVGVVMTQNEVAEMFGMSQSQVSRILNTCKKIALKYTN